MVLCNWLLLFCVWWCSCPAIGSAFAKVKLQSTVATYGKMPKGKSERRILRVLELQRFIFVWSQWWKYGICSRVVRGGRRRMDLYLLHLHPCYTVLQTPPWSLLRHWNDRLMTWGKIQIFLFDSIKRMWWEFNVVDLGIRDLIGRLSQGFLLWETKQWGQEDIPQYFSRISRLGFLVE